MRFQNFIFLYAFVTQCVGCGSLDSNNGVAPTAGDLTYAKLLVYDKVVSKGIPDNFDKEFSAVFLDGNPQEQLIFSREFRRRNIPVKDIGLRVPGIRTGDSDVSTGRRALFFSAIPSEIDRDEIKFKIFCSRCVDDITYVVSRRQGHWEIIRTDVLPPTAIP